MHPQVTMFLEKETKCNVGGASFTSCNSKADPYLWKKDLVFDKIAMVMEKCRWSMRLWEYRANAIEAELDSVQW